MEAVLNINHKALTFNSFGVGKLLSTLSVGFTYGYSNSILSGFWVSYYLQIPLSTWE